MANDDGYHEFEITVRVRKRVHVSGLGVSREAARDYMRRFLQSGININTFAKRGGDGHPIEVIVDNDFEIADPTS